MNVFPPSPSLPQLPSCLSSSVNAHIHRHTHSSWLVEARFCNLESSTSSLERLHHSHTTIYPTISQAGTRCISFFPVFVAFLPPQKLAGKNLPLCILVRSRSLKQDARAGTGCWDAVRRTASIHTATATLRFQGRFHKRSNGCPRECIQIIHEKIHNNE